jgi:chemotaxis protein histidine kinase CheA
MDWSSEISQQDIDVFWQEADEFLQLLSQDFVKLEQQGPSPELIQEIFRAAHTIKGSSAMLGFQRMADLAHAMESLLERVRQGTQAVTTPLVDALLHALDGLNALREELVSADTNQTDIAPYVAELARATDAEDTGAHGAADSGPAPLRVNPEQQERIDALIAENLAIYEVTAELERDNRWPAIRCFQVLNELMQMGEVIASSPTMAEIEEGTAGNAVHAIVASGSQAEALKLAVEQTEEIDSVAMLLQELFPNQPHRLVATDLDQVVLAKARDGGPYTDADIRNVSRVLFLKYFSRDEKLAVRTDLLPRVEFKPHDLLNDPYDRGYDLVLSRNVIIYLNDAAKDRVMAGFSRSLNEGGTLFIGATDSLLNGASFGFKQLAPNFFGKAAVSQQRRLAA